MIIWKGGKGIIPITILVKNMLKFITWFGQPILQNVTEFYIGCTGCSQKLTEIQYNWEIELFYKTFYRYLIISIYLYKWMLTFELVKQKLHYCFQFNKSHKNRFFET